MANDTMIMFGCIMAILTLNTLVFLYNMNPIVTGSDFDFVDTSPTSFETGIEDSGITESSTGLIAIINIGKFFLNIIVMLFGWYPSYTPILNLFIKLGTYTFAIPLFITIVRLIRGV